MPELAPRLFEKAIADLDARMGVKLAEMNAAEIFALVRACEREANPFRGVNADLAGIPLMVCPGVHLWRLTIGAAVWLDEVVEPLVGTGRRYRAALVYALMHAREPERFAGDWSERRLKKECSAALRAVTVTTDELNAALNEVLGLEPRRARIRNNELEGAARDWANIIQRLEAKTGIPALEWLWSKSATHALRSYADLHRMASALAHQRAPEEPPQPELDAAVEARQLLKVEIARAVKARRAENHG